MEIKHNVYNWHIGQAESKRIQLEKSFIFSNPYVQYAFGDSLSDPLKHLHEIL